MSRAARCIQCLGLKTASTQYHGHTIRVELKKVDWRIKVRMRVRVVMMVMEGSDNEKVAVARSVIPCYK